MARPMTHSVFLSELPRRRMLDGTSEIFSLPLRVSPAAARSRVLP